MNYSQLKARLVDRGILAAGFLDKSISEVLGKAINDLVPDTSVYEPLLYEIWLKEVVESLDRLVAYRREAREMEILAVKAAADYGLFLEQSELDLKLDKLRLRISTKQSTVASQTKTSTAFSAEQAPLANGFSENSSGQAADAKAEIAECDVEVDLLNQRQSVVRAFQDAYYNRTQQDGNAHNYQQRAQILWGLVADELLDSYQRALAIAAGIKQIYGVDATVPDPSVPNLIDQLVFWCRRVVRSQAQAAQNEIEFDLIIPLVQPLTRFGSGLISTADFNAKVQSGAANDAIDFGFSLTSESFNSVRVRVRRIGMSYGTKVKLQDSGADINSTTDSLARYRVSVSTPPQGPLGRHRPAVQLGLVSVFGGTSPTCESEGNECINVDPLGKWGLRVSSHPGSKEAALEEVNKGIAGNLMLDIKLHLRVRTIGLFPSP